MIRSLSELAKNRPEERFEFIAQKLLLWVRKYNFDGSRRQLQKWGPRQYRYLHTKERAKIRQILIDSKQIEEYNKKYIGKGNRGLVTTIWVKVVQNAPDSCPFLLSPSRITIK